MTKLTALLLLVTLVSINAKKYLRDLTIDDISGTWVANVPDLIIPIFRDDDFGDPERAAICRDEVTRACDKRIPNVDIQYIINANSMTFDYAFSAYEGANTLEDSKVLFPECFEGETPLSASTDEALVDILGYEESNLDFRAGTFEGCLKWKVFIDGHKVKAQVIRDIDFTIIVGNFPPFIPSTCAEDDDDKKHENSHYFNFEFPDSRHFKPFESEYKDMISSFLDEKKNGNEECLRQPDPDAGELVLKYVLDFEFECISGPCQGLNENYKNPKK